VSESGFSELEDFQDEILSNKNIRQIRKILEIMIQTNWNFRA
jgi:hypothetical protein